jgi:hypothetical protein
VADGQVHRVAEGRTAMNRRDWIQGLGLAGAFSFTGQKLVGLGERGMAPAPQGAPSGNSSPTNCQYAPPGEYVKDHTFVHHDGWWHFYSISGTAGYAWAYTGCEETVSWSISRDLVNWEFRGHVLHASQRKNTFDQDMIWAPFCLEARRRFYMYYAGRVQPIRPMQYPKMGSYAKMVSEGSHSTIGLAVSEDLTRWEKVSDPVNGMGIPGRDPHVVRDELNDRWLLYSTGVQVTGLSGAYVSESRNLEDWKLLGPCVAFPDADPREKRGFSLDELTRYGRMDTAESLTVMRHPLSHKWIALGNWHYVLSDDPTNFLAGKPRLYDIDFSGTKVDMGFACRILQSQGKWYRSGVMGKLDNWQLGFTEIAWTPEGAFRVVKPSRMANIGS